MEHIVKRGGQKEKFDVKKVYASCYYACLTTHMEKKDAEKICDKVSKEVNKWIKNKKEITSENIFKEVIKILKKHSKDSAFMYKTHRDVN
ncbi:hypothetical protein CL617_03790 [archaeon]|nr:hypothetical protein [archaeon]|tara:strand:+ start:37645 stop:37914 length:270 start_codon:yes stop_codon:yes gene_type:complete